jgi:hypothetical protein
MAKQLATITKTNLPENIQVTNLTLSNEFELREAIKIMKGNALNNYLILAKIESVRAFEFMGYSTIDDFIETELKGIISHRNAMNFLEYIKEQTDPTQTLDDKTIAGLLGMYSDEKEDKGKDKKSTKDKDKDKIKHLNKAVESKTIELEQKDAELDALRIQLDELAREKGVDPDRYMIVKSEDSMREYLHKQRMSAVNSINALKDLDPDLLQMVSYGEVKLVLASIHQAMGEVYRQYEQYFVGEDILSKLGD